jgi:hypothetical protein
LSSLSPQEIFVIVVVVTRRVIVPQKRVRNWKENDECENNGSDEKKSR